MLVNNKENSKKSENNADDSNDSKDIFSRLPEFPSIEVYDLSSPASFEKLQKKQRERAIHLLDKVSFLMEEGHYDEAYKLNEKVLNAFPDFFQAILNKGELLAYLDRHQEAFKWFDKAIELSSGKPEVVAHKISVLVDFGDLDQAYQILCSTPGVDLIGFITLGGLPQVFIDAGKITKALSLFDLALEQEPNNSLVHFYKVEALYELSQYEEALASIQVALSRGSMEQDFYELKSLSLLALGRFDEALTIINEALAIYPQDLDLLEVKRNILEQQGQAAEVETIEQLIEDIKPWEELSESFGVPFTGQTPKVLFEDLVHELDRRLLANPNDLFLLTQKVHILHKKGAYSEALQYCERILQEDPQNKEIITLQGQCLIELGSFSQALKAFNRVLVFIPDYLPALEGKASALMFLDRPSERIQCYDQILSLEPNDTSYILALHGKADSLISLGRVQEGIAVYDLALEKEPQNLMILLDKAKELRKFGENEEALKVLDTILQFFPESTKALKAKAYIYFTLDKLQKSLKLLDRLIALDPTDHLAQIFQIKILFSLNLPHQASQKASQLVFPESPKFYADLEDTELSYKKFGEMTYSDISSNGFDLSNEFLQEYDEETETEEEYADSLDLAFEKSLHFDIEIDEVIHQFLFDFIKEVPLENCNPYALRLKGLYNLFRKDLQTALVCAEYGLALYPKNVDWNIIKGLVAALNKNASLAQKHFKDAGKLANISVADLLFNYGLLLEQFEPQSRIALICYNNATFFNPDHLQSWEKLAGFFKQIGNTSAYQKCLHRIKGIKKKFVKKVQKN